MAQQRDSHRLAVILHADVVGSTTLVQRDERLAHERITAAFQSASRAITRYHGIVHEIRGDALVAEFARASDAVSAALEVQHENSSRNAELTDGIVPEIRIGIALGEVVIADATVTGAGVVLAQRIEQLADSNGVCITEAIHEALPNRLPFDYESLGTQSLKGFEQQVYVHKVQLPPGHEVPPPSPQDSRGQRKPYLAVVFATVGLLFAVLLWFKPWQADVPLASPEQPVLALPDKPSVAVLPFRSLGGDSDQQFMADGLTQNIITTLSAVKELFVIGRSSVFRYKNQEISAIQVARDLGVRYVLEGSLQSSGDNIRVNAELVDTSGGDTVWSERYDRPLQDIFEIQDGITLKIVSGLTGSIFDVTSASGTENLQAWVYAVQAQEAYEQFTRESTFKARELANKALELDPDYIYAMVYKAYSYYFAGRVGWEPFNEALTNAQRLAARMRELSPDSAQVQGLIGTLELMQGRHEEAVRAAERSIVLSPGSAVWHAVHGWFLYEAGRHKESVDAMSHAIRLNPLRPSWYDMYYIRAHVFLGRYDEAIVLGEQALLQATSPATQSFLMLSIAFAQVEKGDHEAAHATVQEAVLQAPWMNQKMYRWFYRTQNSADLERFMAAMARAGMPEGS